MSVYIFGVRIYLDSIPSVANASDIGLYTVSGENSVFRLIETDISSYSPTYTWKTGILKPAPFDPINESVDLLEGGNLPRVGGGKVRIINTVIYGGAYTQLDDILESNSIRFNGLRLDIIEFEVSGGSLVNADGTIRARYICGDSVWNEKTMAIPYESAYPKRRANLSTIINETDYPDADPNIMGKTIPVSFGEFKPEFDVNENPTYNGYAKFVRVANKESIYENANGFELAQNPIVYAEFATVAQELGIFPIVSNGGGDTPTTYSILICENVTEIAWFEDEDPASGTLDLNWFEGKYIKVVQGEGKGQNRRIVSASVVAGAEEAENAITFVIQDIFETTLAGNATATATSPDQSWIQIIDIAREYQSDVWPCKDYLDIDGAEITTGLNLFSYSSPKKAKVTIASLNEETDSTVEEKPLEFYRLPEYAYEDTGNGNNNSIDIDVKLFKDSPDQMDSFLILPVKNFELFDGVVDDWFDGLGAGTVEDCSTKEADGLYSDNALNCVYTFDNNDWGNRENAIDKLNNTMWNPQYSLLMSGGTGDPKMAFLTLFELPDYPKRFEHDSIYIGAYITETRTTEGAGIGHIMYLYHRKFMGTSSEIITLGSSANDLTLRNILDQYYTNNVSNNNQYFYHDNDAATVINGYMNFELTTINTKELYKSVKSIMFANYGLWVDLGNDEGGDVDLKIYELCAMFRKSISIKDAIYSPFQGRRYVTEWGQAGGSSSYSLSSSSSASSQSLSSQSSASATGSGRKDVAAMINNPVDILEHTMRLQNWSEQGENKDWGKEYADEPLINISTTEGGFDYTDLSDLKAYRPARQLLSYNECWSDRIAASLCRQFFMVSFQNPATGEECVSYIPKKAGDTPATTITLSDIIGEISDVSYPKNEGIYCEPFIRYGKNNANGNYEKLIQIKDTNKDTYDSSYVIGVSGADAEMLWTRGHILWQVTRQITPPPNDMVNHDWIISDSDALSYLDDWFTWMGAINVDGDPENVVFIPKKRIAFSVPYEIGKAWFLSQHHLLQLPHQTDGDAIEFLIEKSKKSINKGKEMVNVQVVLYGETAGMRMYIQDVYHDFGVKPDWQDDYETKAEDGTQGEDIQDIT